MLTYDLPVRTAIVVPGHGSFDRRGRYRISARCASLVAEAERLARRSAPEAVVFSGWAPPGGVPEAEQMLGLWHVPGIETLVEPTARSTAENASRTLPLLLERAIERAVVVCAPLHLYRTRYFFGRLYGPAGIQVAVRPAPVAPSAGALVWELLALSVRRSQLHAARAELKARRRR